MNSLTRRKSDLEDIKALYGMAGEGLFGQAGRYRQVSRVAIIQIESIMSDLEKSEALRAYADNDRHRLGLYARRLEAQLEETEDRLTEAMAAVNQLNREANKPPQRSEQDGQSGDDEAPVVLWVRGDGDRPAD